MTQRVVAEKRTAMASLLEISNMSLFGLCFKNRWFKGWLQVRRIASSMVFSWMGQVLETHLNTKNKKSTIHSKTAEGQGSCIPGNGSKNPVKKRDPEMSGVGTNLTEALPIHGIRMGLQSPGLLSFRAVSCFEAWFWPRNGELFCIVQSTRWNLNFRLSGLELQKGCNLRKPYEYILYFCLFHNMWMQKRPFIIGVC